MTDEPLTPEDLAAEAFDSSLKGYFLEGKRLAEWNEDRAMAAHKMKMRAPWWNDHDLKAINGDQLYDSALEDIMIFYYLLSLPMAGVEQAADDPASARKAAKTWAKANKLYANFGKKTVAAYWKMLEIFKDMQTSEFNVEEEAGKKKPGAKDATSRPA